jgi:broad specificity phosphatase PhoE
LQNSLTTRTEDDPFIFDCGLTEKGRKQAEEAAEKIKKLPRTISHSIPRADLGFSRPPENLQHWI